MSSIKTRKHYVLADLGFSAVWAGFYFLAFLVMCVAWSKSSEEYAFGSANIIGAIFFALLSIAAWVRTKQSQLLDGTLKQSK